MWPIWSLLINTTPEQLQKLSLKLQGDYALISQLLKCDLNKLIAPLDPHIYKILSKTKFDYRIDYNLHNSVKRFLEELGVIFYQEHLFGVLSLDFYLPGYDMVIELDGPSHFIVREDGSLQLSGTSAAKHRVVRKQFKYLFVVTGNLVTTDVNSFDDSMEEIAEIIN